MKQLVDNCVDCKSSGLACKGKLCKNYPHTAYVCDDCEEEDVLYKYDGGTFCKKCLLEKFEMLKIDERVE